MFTFFFFSDTSTTEIYTLSLHDALPIYQDAVADACVHSVEREDHLAAVGAVEVERLDDENLAPLMRGRFLRGHNVADNRSEEHTSELQSLRHLVCRLLLEKKKKKYTNNQI